MKKILLILAASLVAIAVIFVGSSLTAYVVSEIIEEDENEFDYIWTTAICEGNTCKDYNVTCKDGKAIDMFPITGEIVFSEDWEDPRGDVELCEGR